MREIGRRSEAAEAPFQHGKTAATVLLVVSRLAVPKVLGKPLILTRSDGRRLVVSATCPAAHALGLSVGMAAAQAKAFVADLEVRPHDTRADEHWLERLALHAVTHWTPVAAPAPPDGVWLDLTGTTHLFGGEERFCRRAVAFLGRLGITAVVAVADTPGAAHALARHAQQPVTITPPGQAAQVLADLPVSALRWDAGPLDAARRFGFERIGDLLAVPRAPLTRRLGRAAVERLDQALGRVAEPIVPWLPEEAITAERRLAEPISTAEAIAHVIDDLVIDLVVRLREAGRGVRRLALTCRRVDDSDQRLVCGLASASRDAAHLRRLLHRLIEEIEPGFGVEVMRLDALASEPLDGTPIRADLADATRSDDLSTLLDQLAGRAGPDALYRTTSVESDVPERSVARCDPLVTVRGWPDYPRPARLLHRPEVLDQVVALLPDAPPRRFRWRGCTHRVVAGDGPERIHGEWWRREGEVWGVRDYYRVEDEQGGRFWVFRRGDGTDVMTGDMSWHLHGVFG